jgi:hypothetical protein
MRVDDPAAATTAAQYGVFSLFFRFKKPGTPATS